MEHTLEENLDYVRGAIQRQPQTMPLAAASLWSAYLIVGLTAIDLRAWWAPWFMMLGMPTALVIDAFILRTARRKEGVVGSREVIIDIWSSFVFILGYMIVIGLAMTGRLSWEAMHSMIAVIVGTQIYNGGLTMQRGLKPSLNRVMLLGLLYMAGAIAMAFQPQWIWTSLAWITAIVFFSMTPLFASKGKAKHA